MRWPYVWGSAGDSHGSWVRVGVWGAEAGGRVLLKVEGDILCKYVPVREGVGGGV